MSLTYTCANSLLTEIMVQAIGQTLERSNKESSGIHASDLVLAVICFKFRNVTILSTR